MDKRPAAPRNDADFPVRIGRAVFSAGLLLYCVAALAQPVDFGQARLEAGREAFAQRQYLKAIEDFRIASFALLNRPAPLLESLARLALAQSAAARPADERRATLERFLDVERQFNLYSELALEPEIREAFRALLLREVPAETLSAVPRLRGALAGRREPTGTPTSTETRTPAPPSPTRTATRTPTRTPVPPSPTLTHTPTAVPTRTSTPMPPTPVPADTSTRTPARTPVPPSRTLMEWSAPTRPQTLARAPLSAPRATRTPVAQPVDFGQARLEAGREAFAQRQYLEAIEDFRIASFALLNRPAPLLESLARLALAQSAAARPADERRATLERFFDVERQFHLYGELALEPEIREAFRALVLREVPAETLSAPQLRGALAGRREPPPTTSAGRAIAPAVRVAPSMSLTPTENLIRIVTRSSVPTQTDTPTSRPTGTAVLPPATPTPTPTPTNTRTTTQTVTSTLAPPTWTASPTSTRTPTNSPIPPSATPAPTGTPTSTETRTPAPPSPTRTATRTPTRTPVPPSPTLTHTPTAVPTRTSTPMPPTPVPADTSTRTPARTPVPPSRTLMEWSAPTRPQTLARAPLSARRATRTPATAPATPPFSVHLDRPPSPILVVNPIYPPEDLRARIRGIVVLRVLVSETGVPVEVVIIEPARGHLTEAAVAAIRRWRFDPAFKAGQPVRAWVTVQVPFEAIPYPTAAPTKELQTSPTDPGHENAKR